MEICGVEANRSQNFRLEGGAKGEMSAETDSHRANLSVAIGASEKVIDDGARVRIVACDGFGVFVDVSAIGTSLIVGEDFAERLES